MSPENSRSEFSKGVIALFTVTLTWALFSIFARAMHGELGNAYQLSLRLVTASIFLVLLKPSLLNLERYKKYTRGDWKLLGLRSVLFTGLGSLPWVAAINSTDIATTSFVQALPFTCLWGVLIFKERRPLLIWCILAFAVLGAALMFGILPGQSIRFGRGECLALISATAFPLALILRKKHSPAPDDWELSLLVLLLGAAQAFPAAYLLGESFPLRISLWMAFLGTIGGILVAASLFFSSYGMPRVSGMLSGIIFALESPLCVLLGLAVYGEIPTLNTLMGGAMIVAAVIAMCVAEQRYATAAPSTTH
ncbi:MAG: DMT family transporter [Deltaproteobacteria bacterium]|nr:DMT family transporter [Deltaproteobacteria bacterium]